MILQEVDATTKITTTPTLLCEIDYMVKYLLPPSIPACLCYSDHPKECFRTWEISMDQP